MIARLDHWLGARVFVPIVVWICQRVSISQHRFHNYGWMIGLWALLYAAGKSGATIIVLFPLALGMTVLAGAYPERPGHSVLWLRIFLVVGETIHWTGHALHELGFVAHGVLLWGVRWDTSCAAGLVILAAEYAAIIKTIPPRPARQQRGSRVAPSAA